MKNLLAAALVCCTCLFSTLSKAANDQFGVEEIYSTCTGCREWYQSNEPVTQDTQIYDESKHTTWVDAGVYKGSGQVRMNVISPDGGAWWRNIEMTAYYQLINEYDAGDGERPHWELFARGERHSHLATTKGQINKGVAPPAGTSIWPWFNAIIGNNSPVDPACLGTSYHGDFYVSTGGPGEINIQKEISHTEGYTHELVKTHPTYNSGNWIGFKTIIRNEVSNNQVRIETWIDPLNTNTWTLESAINDTIGNPWPTDNDGGLLDNCNLTPYDYSQSQILTWAGPWATFRSDDINTYMAKMSIREIDPVCDSLGGACWTNDDCCDANNLCDNSTQRSKTGLCCQGTVGLVCSVDTNCCIGIAGAGVYGFCDTDAGVCSCFGAGIACTINNHCCSGQCGTTTGVCDTGLSSTYCTQNTDCQSGTCNGNSCQ